MSHHLQFFGCFAVLLGLITSTLTARLSSYTPLSDQTYQDILRQQFLRNQLQLEQQQQQQQQTLQEQQRKQQQQQRQQYTPRAYENRFTHNQPQAILGTNYRNLEQFQYAQQQVPSPILQIPFNQQFQLQQQQQQQQQQLPYYQRQQALLPGKPILAEQQYPQHYPIINTYPANSQIYESRRHSIAPSNVAAYQGANGLVPYYNSDFSYARQNQIGSPSSRDFVQLSTNGIQLNRASSTNPDYAAHFDSYLRKYPQRLEPRFGVQNYLRTRE